MRGLREKTKAAWPYIIIFLLMVSQAVSAQQLDLYNGKLYTDKINGRSILEIEKVAKSISAMIGKSRFENLRTVKNHERTGPTEVYSDAELGELYILGKSSYQWEEEQLYLLSSTGTAVGVCLSDKSRPGQVQWYGTGWSFVSKNEARCRDDGPASLVARFKAAREAKK